MAIGGFNGSDPSPTLAEFQQHVADGEIHWFIAAAVAAFGGGPNAGGSDLVGHRHLGQRDLRGATTVDGVTVYDLIAGHRDNA